MQTSDSEKTIDKLNALLRGEISAVETYDQAISRLETVPARSQLEQCRRSHERRVQRLRDTITQLGGQPSTTSGPWGGFAKFVEGGAKLLGEKAAIAALEEGEDHGLKQYRSDLNDLSGPARDIVSRELLPEQEQTHSVMSQLKHVQ